MNATEVIDPCVECGESTAPGFGRWVNRLIFDDGYKCIECLGSVFECDRCGKDIPFDEDVVVEVQYDYEVPDAEHGVEIRFRQDRLGPCCHKEDDRILA